VSNLGAPSSSVLPAIAPEPPPRRRLVWAAAIGGALVLALVLAVVFWPRSGPDGSAAPVAQSSTPAASSPATPGATSQAAAPAGSVTPSAPASSPAGSASVPATPTAGAPAKPAASYTPPPHVSSVTRMGAQLATGLVTGKGIEVPGVVTQAVQWQDKNGRNVLLAGERIDHNRGDGDVDAGAVVVMLVSNLDGKAKVLRKLTDATGTPTEPCPTDFGMEVLPGSLTVRDDDHDGVGEATVAWWIACAGDVQRFPSRLAVLSGTDKYQLNGLAMPKVGSPSYTEAQRKSMKLAAGTFSASPGRGSWPVNSYARATALFRQLFS
jgi:hypothetical protein